MRVENLLGENQTTEVGICFKQNNTPWGVAKMCPFDTFLAHTPTRPWYQIEL